MLDLIIIGSSAAGASAGVYAARRNLNFKIITLDTGGEVALSGEVGNFPGWGETDGIAISEKFVEHLKIYKVEPETDIKVVSIETIPSVAEGSSSKSGQYFKITGEKTGEQVSFEAKTVIVTTGVQPRQLGVPGEEKYRGKGVTYCTTCDGPLFRDKVVATIGGGNSGLESALMMNDIATKVYLINLYGDFSKGEPILVDKVKQSDKIEIIYEAKTTEIFGEDFVKGLKYKDSKDQEHSLGVEGIFVHIGMIPNNDFLPADIDKDQFGQIKIDLVGATNIPGFFAAGDVTNIPYKQIAIASGQGVSAVLTAVDYLNKLAV